MDSCRMSNVSNIILIGVAGASGSGKSYFARRLQQQLDRSSLLLSQDDYYKDRSDITLEERESINYDHPDSLDFELLVQHLTMLKDGLAIEHPLYDFSVHNRKTETAHVEPAEVILVDGILLYAVDQCRELFDIKVFVDTPMDFCFVRRLQRDIQERGRSVDSVISQYLATVRPMFIEFVEPTKEQADVVVDGAGEVTDDILRVLSMLN
jgi:uridine kinase